MIGVTRRVLEAMLADVSPKHPTHEVLTTLMAEASAIINAMAARSSLQRSRRGWSFDPSEIADL